MACSQLGANWVHLGLFRLSTFKRGLGYSYRNQGGERRKKEEDKRDEAKEAVAVA